MIWDSTAAMRWAAPEPPQAYLCCEDGAASACMQALPARCHQGHWPAASWRPHHLRYVTAADGASSGCFLKGSAVGDAVSQGELTDLAQRTCFVRHHDIQFLLNWCLAWTCRSGGLAYCRCSHAKPVLLLLQAGRPVTNSASGRVQLSWQRGSRRVVLEEGVVCLPPLEVCASHGCGVPDASCRQQAAARGSMLCVVEDGVPAAIEHRGRMSPAHRMPRGRNPAWPCACCCCMDLKCMSVGHRSNSLGACGPSLPHHPYTAAVPVVHLIPCNAAFLYLHWRRAQAAWACQGQHH